MKRGVKFAGRKAASSRWLEGLARGGFAACGVNYMLVGLLAVQIALGIGGKAADAAGAVHAVAAHTGGLVLLWLVAVGFAGLALWRLAEVVYGQASPNGQTVTKRLASLGRALMYIALCIGIVTFLLGVGSQRSGNKQSKDFTATLMSFTGGRWLVLLVGLGVVGVGLSMMVEAVRRKFVDNLHMTQMSARTRGTVQALGIVGIFARGGVFAVLGTFFIIAAATFDSKQAQGLDGTLRKIASTPLGPWLLVAVALGLVTFGVYSCFEARWRKTEPG
ncbi:DUF1206 domain-containing protein [Nonomuraea sp. NEAU-A123]|uniref:DUF1206 domain-containing protein n=1 Tax=Nonomuraea sp. NEAU-A123 TaxID=2839649 RepID=UPI0027DF63BE|nr:DUF1206 domain-containing protein [Nonomuraea sp. NEAU-A123]